MSRPKSNHLTKRADGRFRCYYNGKQFMGRTEPEAKAKREQYKKSLLSGPRKDQQSVSQYAAYWLPIHKADVKESTYNVYVSILNRTIEPIAGAALADVTTDHISEIFSSMRGMSASYIHKARILLSAVFQSAVDAGYISKNPVTAPSIKPPKGTKGTHRVITSEERSLIMSTPHRMQFPALIMLYCGLRRGEVLALTADDIQNDTLTVSKAVSFISNKPIISEPKTEAGKRTVPIPEIILPYLSGLSGPIAKSASGQPMTEQAFMRGWESYLHTLTKAAGHPISFRPHDLRVSYCTMLFNLKIDMHQAIIWMGHADEKMILRVYDKPGPERAEEAKKRLNSAITVQKTVQPEVEPPETLVPQRLSVSD